MSVYVRLGIRLLYKGLGGSSMEKKKSTYSFLFASHCRAGGDLLLVLGVVRKLLASLSVKQGKKFDNPASARDIKGFIAFHQLDLSEVLKPLDQFKT